jgi:hypothetical protein
MFQPYKLDYIDTFYNKCEAGIAFDFDLDQVT